MKISTQGLNLVKKWEGFRATAYLCPAGVPTIGYGTTKWENGKAVKLGETISQEKALQLLEKQVNEHASTIPTYVKRSLTQNQFDALASFQYNLGKHILNGNQTLVKALNNGDWKTATAQMLLYNKARVNGKLTVLKGLDNRRKEEVALFNLTSQTSTQSVTVSDEMKRARNIIRKAVSNGVFTDPHKDVDKYSESQLLKYMVIYIERTGVK